jgi:hypothetical protein
VVVAVVVTAAVRMEPVAQVVEELENILAAVLRPAQQILEEVQVVAGIMQKVVLAAPASSSFAI